MEQAADNIATQKAPGDLSNQEMERLLDEAASLSDEIASESEDHPDDPAQELEPQPGASEEQAAEALLSDEPDDAAPTTGREKDLPDLLHDPDTGLTATPPQAEASTTPEESGENDDAGSADDPGKPEAPETQPEESGVQQGSRPRGEDHRNFTDSELEGSQNLQTDAEGETEPPATKRPVLKRLAALVGSAFRFARQVAVATLNACLRTVVLLDRPFCGLPMGIKRGLGIVAVATLLVGIGAWFLPGLLNQNPFADMDRYTQTMR